MSDAEGRPAALVTGSAKGVGRAIVLGLAEAGYDVAVHYRSSEREAREVKAQAERRGARAAVLRADVTEEREARGLVDAAHQEFGRLDVLVNNVGNYHQGPIDQLTSEIDIDPIAMSRCQWFDRPESRMLSPAAMT